jgi:hypothetical protein
MCRKFSFIIALRRGPVKVSVIALQQPCLKLAINMQENTKYLVVAAAFVALMGEPSLGAVVVAVEDPADPSTDLSDSGDSPSILPDPQSALSVGTHSVSGRVWNDFGTREDLKDYWTFEVAPDTEITSIRLTLYDNSSYTTIGGGGFFGIAQGSTITATNSSVGNLIGGALVGVTAGTAVGDELLDDLLGGISFGPFTISSYPGALGAGEYSFWFQEGNPLPTTPAPIGPGSNSEDDYVDYTFEFTVAQVPEPSPVIMLAALGLAAICYRSRNLAALLSS